MTHRGGLSGRAVECGRRVDKITDLLSRNQSARVRTGSVANRIVFRVGHLRSVGYFQGSSAERQWQR